MDSKSGAEIARIVGGCTKEGRAELLAILGEAVTTLDNLDAICPVLRPPCHAYLQFNNIRRLYAALSAQVVNESAEVSRTPKKLDH